MSKAIDDPFLHCALSHVLLAQRKRKAAEEAAEEAIRCDPEFAEAHFQLALVLRDRGLRKEGLAAVGRALDLDPWDPDFHATKAGLHFDGEDWEQALADAEEGLALDPEDETCLFYRGLALAKLGREDEADEDSLKLLAHNADDATHHMHRGFVLLEAGKGAEASRFFTGALRADPESENARQGLIQATVLNTPVLGWILKGLGFIERFPLWAMVVAAMVWGLVAGTLRKTQLGFIGTGLDILFWGILGLIFLAPLLFEWVLLQSGEARHAIRDRHRKGVWQALPFVLLALLAVLWWLVTGSKGTPVLAFAPVATALIVREIQESDNRWVRRCFLGIALAAILVSLGVYYAQFFVIGPRAVELVAQVANLKEEGKESAGHLLADFRELRQLRNWIVVYPSLALVFGAGFRTEIGEKLETRAPDSEWE